MSQREKNLKNERMNKISVTYETTSNGPTYL